MTIRQFIRKKSVLIIVPGVSALLLISLIILTYRQDNGVSAVIADKFMISTANPQATRAGYHILKDGGTAMDAIIAVQMVLNVVEPQSSGIGGGAFLLYWDDELRRLHAYDGREMAPISATPDLFVKADGSLLGFNEALIGGRAVGTPGLLKMLELGHQKHGNLNWEILFNPAIDIARRGFEVSDYLARQISQTQNKTGGLEVDPETRKLYLTASGMPKPPGSVITNEALASTFELIAKKGTEVFYNGPVRDDIVHKVQNSLNPGLLKQEDFSIYSAKERPPLCQNYRKYRVCSVPPPSSGGITLLQTLMQLERFDLPSMGYSVEGVHLFIEASRLSFADRNKYIADSDFVSVPVAGLLDTTYTDSRSQLINKDQSIEEALPGQPPALTGLNRGQHGLQPGTGTTHIVAVDTYGNVASMTSTIESGFGSRLTVRGFLLNNELTDFSFKSKVNGQEIANRVQPGKRPRSSMTPVIVFDRTSGSPVLAIGSPGGSRIINYVGKSLVAILDWDMGIDTAIHIGNFTGRKEPIEIEKDTEASELKNGLELLGHTVEERELKSGLTGILIRAEASSGRLEGSADRRREGSVMGE